MSVAERQALMDELRRAEEEAKRRQRIKMVLPNRDPNEEEDQFQRSGNDMYQIKKKMFKGESIDQDTINQLVDLCEDPNLQLSPSYVWNLLHQKDRKCKVYMKNKRILSKQTKDGVAGFVIYTFEPKSEDEGFRPKQNTLAKTPEPAVEPEIVKATPETVPELEVAEDTPAKTSYKP